MTTPASKAQPRIEIFASGQHKAVDGKAWAFDGAALDQIVRSYDFAANPAPIVVGHPTLDAPAYGWVKALQREGDKIVADLDEVEPAFAEAVKAGRYKRVSASFYPPDHAGNPTPGSWHLKHVGFLGAAAPAIRGSPTFRAMPIRSRRAAGISAGTDAAAVTVKARPERSS